MNRKIIVIGNYRSGTTLLAKAIRIASGVVGKSHEYPDEERPDVRTLSEQALQQARCSWANPKEIDSASKLLLKQRDRVAKSLTWGFKDPSAMWLHKWWLAALPDAQPVGTFRRPAAVVNSLLASFPTGKRDLFEELWQKYALRLIELYDQNPFPLINFDSDRYEDDLGVLLANLDLTLDFSLLGYTREESSGPEEATAESMALYEELRERAIDTTPQEADENAWDPPAPSDTVMSEGDEPATL